MAQTYSDPVAKLLSYGKCEDSQEWPDYLELGFNESHIPELIKMATDQDLHHDVSESDAVWAPVHAWRTLAQLGAEEAIEPLLNIFWMCDDNDEWVFDELPMVMGKIGFNGISRFSEYLREKTNGIDARIMVARSLKLVAQEHPEKKDECIKILTEKLAEHSDEDEDFNGFIIAYLVELKATESIETIRDAYEADSVTVFFAGDFETVEIELGLKKERTKPREDGFLPGRVSNIIGQDSQENQKPQKKKKIGRNEPCPCGSGKKYKKCCLK
jgi:hypothetical protein